MARQRVSVEGKSAQEEANEYLSNAANVYSEMRNIEREKDQMMQENGDIDSGTSEQALTQHADQVGRLCQATFIVNNPPTTAAHNFLAQQMRTARHMKGSTWTDRYGDMRSYGGGSNATQRAINTRLTNPASLHDQSGGRHHRRAASTKTTFPPPPPSPNA